MTGMVGGGRGKRWKIFEKIIKFNNKIEKEFEHCIIWMLIGIF